MVFPHAAVIAVPDPFGIGVRPQVVNVPMGAAGWLQMVPEPGTETSRAMGAADVHVESGLKLQAAKLADTDGRSFGGCENEGVGSGLRLHHVSDGITFVLWMC
jgi:hypothetical protein